MKSILITFLAVLSCLFFYGVRQRKDKPEQFLIWAAHFAVFGCAVYLFVSMLISTFAHPQVWDFSAFYLWGKTAARGYDFYLPENSSIVFHSINLPNLDYTSFTKEVVNVGFYYPPQTMFYFVPLGFLSYKVAFLTWTVLNLCFLVGSIYLVYDQFFRGYKLNGLLFVSTLVFAFAPVRETILYSQTNFILLFYLLLIKKFADKKIAGVFLAVAVFTKPYIAILCIYFLIRKKWRILSYFALTATAITVATVLAFGKGPMLSYFFNNPAQRIPSATFSEDINQSLHAVLLRAGLITLDKPLPYIFMLIFALLLTGIYMSFLSRQHLYEDLLVTVLLVGLLLYPGTLSYYAVILLYVIFQFLNEKSELGFNETWSLGIIATMYWLTSYSIFACLCLILATIILRSFSIVGSSNPLIRKRNTR